MNTMLRTAFALIATFAVAGLNAASAQTPPPAGAKVTIVNL